ncbi:hypothetical protein [Streptomyces mirabilis]|uniref:hypothetical protein n=1 Tax=Streptomyces mirabilis TaxID=68239 RepID=UPI0033E6F9F4
MGSRSEQRIPFAYPSRRHRALVYAGWLTARGKQHQGGDDAKALELSLGRRNSAVRLKPYARS